MPKAQKKDSHLVTLFKSQSVVLKQSTTWSRGIIWGIVGVTVVSMLWAYVAKLEQVVSASGKLIPQGQVKEVDIPLNGVVKEVYVKDGDSVAKGQLLATLDQTASKAQLSSLLQVRQLLKQENTFYQTVMNKNLSPQAIEKLIPDLKLPREVVDLLLNRVSLQKESNLLQLGLGSLINNSYYNLSKQERARLNAIRLEALSRTSAADLEVKQQNEQLKEVIERVNNDRQLIAQDKLMLKEIIQRNRTAIDQSKKGLQIDRLLLSKMEPLLVEGAVGEYQVEKQKQQISDRNKDLIQLIGNGQLEYDKQNEQLQSHSSELKQLLKERSRLIFVTLQAKQKLVNTTATTQKDNRDKIEEINQKIAEIDSNLNKTIIENNKKIAETDSQISQANVNLSQQQLRAPEKGVVFDLKASPGYVSSAVGDKPVMKIVPSENLIAEVDITNQDIGFVRNGQKVDVRIDTFPYSEFGDIKGEVLSIGSDVLPPDETHKFYRFPTRIKLNVQSIKINDQTINLQSGMAVTVNIKVNEDRTVMSLITGIMRPKIESLKRVR
jgi:HlyD family secretion protein